MNQQPRSIRKIAILLIAGLLILATPLVYFFAWRASDNDYMVTSQYLDYMTKTNKTITVEVSSIKHPGLINQTTPIKLGVLSANYAKIHEALETSPAIARDFSVSAVFNKHKSALMEHKQSLVNLAQSIKLYETVLDECKKVTDSLIGGYNDDAFKSLLASCRTAIKKGETDSKHKPFNDQFLNEYLTETTKYMTTVEKLVNTTTGSETDKVHEEMEAIYDKISNLGSIELDLGLVNMTNIYSDILSSLESQKKAFLR